MKLTIDQFSKEFKISKEAIHSRIKEKKLDYVIENDTLYIITPEQTSTQPVVQEVVEPTVMEKPKSRPTVSTILSLYQKENKQLKEKIAQLEQKIDQLIADKEAMLQAERDKIEEIYTSKDTQLKEILQLIQTNLSLQQTTPKKVKKEEPKLIELKEYLKSLELDSHQRKKIKKRFLEVYNNDVRIIQQNGKLFLDLAKYDYSDLLAL